MLLNQKQACGYLGIGRYLFESAVNQGYIPFVKPSKRRLFNTEDLDRWQRNTQTHTDYTKTEEYGMRISLSHGKTVKASTIGELLAQEIEQRRKDGLLRKLTKPTKKTLHPKLA